MAKMIVTEVSRKVASKGQFVIAVTKASGEEATLATTIQRIQRDAPEFRKIGGRTYPVDQYAFEVNGKTVDRFADATAIVLKRHNIEIAEGAKVPTYVSKAVALNAA